MKYAELKGKTHDELVDLIRAAKKELFNLRFQKSTGELENTARMRKVTKDIARYNTAMTELKTNKAA